MNNKWRLSVALALVALSVGNALPVPEDKDATPKASSKSTNPDESKVYQDMLRLLEEVEESQVKLKEAVVPSEPLPERRKDDTAATPTKLLDMERIVKALENVASTLSKGSKGLQADASSTDEAVLRNERDSAGYGSPSYGPNTVAETPNNFINVFSQAAANTVNFGTQLLNSLVGVAANILQGTVSTLLSLLNAKGQIVGAVVQSAPPVLASVTRTAGDVLAAKARIFGAVTQSAVNFASQLAQTVTNTFAGLFNGPNAINFNALGRSGEGNALGGFGNFAQTIINSQLNLLNGILSPFTGGGNGGGGSLLGAGSNPLAALFGPRAPSGSTSGYTSNGNGASAKSSSGSEPNFRITIAASTAATPSEPADS